MVDLYSGTPGSGKSLHTAKEIRDRLILGKPTLCNFEINYSGYKRAVFQYVPNDKLTPDFLVAYAQEWWKTHRFREDGIWCVIDECQLMFNAREWQATGRAEWLSFFTQHRKYGYHIVLIAQFDRMVDRQIRSLIEYEYVHRKVSNFGIGVMLLSLIMGGNTFVAVQSWYPLKTRIGSQFFHARKAYYRLYDSYSTFAKDAGTANGAVGDSGAPSAPFADTATLPTARNASKKPILLRSLYHRACGFIKSFLASLLEGFRSSGRYQRPGGRSETGWKS